MELSSSKIEKFLVFLEIELFGSDIKFLFSFLKRKLLVIFRETLKKILMFLETELSYTLGNGNPKKLNKFSLYFFILLIKHFIKLFYTLNKTPLGETGCLNNLYYLLAAQASSF